MTLYRRALIAGSTAGAVSLPFSRIAVGQTNEPIRISVLASLSGPGEPAGRSIKLGAELAAMQINKTGGVNGRNIALEFRDDKGNVAQATAMARELLGSGVNLLTGTSQSAVALAIGPVMQQENGIMVGSIAASDKINHQNYCPNYIRASESPLARYDGLAQIAARKYPQVRRWSGIIPDYEYGRASWAMLVDGLLKAYSALGGDEIVVVEPTIAPFGAPDYKTFITSAMRKNFDGFFMGAYGNDTITFYQQARPYGLLDKAKVILDGGNEFVVARALQKRSPSYWSATYWYPENDRDVPLSQALVANYQATGGKMPPEGVLAEGHADIMLYAKAISVARSTETGAVLNAMKGLEWDTATGKRTIRAADNQSIRDVEFVLAGPAENADGFKVEDFAKLSGAALAEPPTPGQALELRKAG